MDIVLVVSAIVIGVALADPSVQQAARGDLSVFGDFWRMFRHHVGR